MLHYALRTREGALSTMPRPPPACRGSLVGARHARSILCLPSIHQAKLIGVLSSKTPWPPGLHPARRGADAARIAGRDRTGERLAVCQRQRHRCRSAAGAGRRSPEPDAQSAVLRLHPRSIVHELESWRQRGVLGRASGAETVGKVTHDLLKTVFPLPLEQIEAAVLPAGRWEGELVPRQGGRRPGGGGEPVIGCNGTSGGRRWPSW